MSVKTSSGLANTDRPKSVAFNVASSPFFDSRKFSGFKSLHTVQKAHKKCMFSHEMSFVLPFQQREPTKEVFPKYTAVHMCIRSHIDETDQDLYASGPNAENCDIQSRHSQLLLHQHTFMAFKSFQPQDQMCTLPLDDSYRHPEHNAHHMCM
jgi:hypothetical protein